MRDLNLIYLILFVGFTACNYSSNPPKMIEYLEGTWRVENKESFEEWTRKSNTELEGRAYEIKDGKEIVKERISLIISPESSVYSATVLDQNNGEEIQFKLNENRSDAWSFENLSHDFPKKIIYKALNKNKIRVEVLGDDNEGFNVNLQRVVN